MGGSTRGNRVSYAASRQNIGNNHKLTSYNTNNNGSAKRVFISFHMDDEYQVNLLRHQAKDDRFDIEFTDYSIKEPFDEKWKTQCTERINQSSTVIIMIGEETHNREAVLWEINKAYELGKKVIGVRIYRDENHKIPQPLINNRAKIMDWNLENISRELNRG